MLSFRINQINEYLENDRASGYSPIFIVRHPTTEHTATIRYSTRRQVMFSYLVMTYTQSLTDTQSLRDTQSLTVRFRANFRYPNTNITYQPTTNTYQQAPNSIEL